MKMLGFDVVVFPEGKGYTSWCPQLDVASQGKTMEKAITSLKEAIGLHLECMGETERSKIKARRPSLYTARISVPLPA